MDGEIEYDVWRVHIRDDYETEWLAQINVDIHPEDTTSQKDERVLILTRGNEPEPDEKLEDEPYIFYGADSGDYSCTSIADVGVTLGYYLGIVEMNGVEPESEVMKELGEYVDMEPYWAFIDDLSPRKRRHRLLDLLEWRVDVGDDWIAEKYLHEYPTEFREKGLSDSGDQLAQTVLNQIDAAPALCYKTAQEAAVLHQNNHRVTYVEGIALPKHAGQAVRHAWIEYDDSVVELTWPWHHFDGAEGVYFGVKFPMDDVVEARETRDFGGPVVLSEEENVEMLKAGRGI